MKKDLIKRKDIGLLLMQLAVWGAIILIPPLVTFLATRNTSSGVTFFRMLWFNLQSPFLLYFINFYIFWPLLAAKRRYVLFVLANIVAFMRNYPHASVVASAKAFAMMEHFYGKDYADRRLVVGEGDTLSLGRHTLSFVTAPMVHWPEVLVTYDSADKVLFSADGFGKFGALDVEEDWACEARRYYFGIVGKYGAQVQALLKKAANLDIRTICPTHGPVLQGDLSYYLDLYNTWSSSGVESEGVVIAYTSVYGHTKAAAELLAKKLEDRGCPKVSITDLARDDMPEAVEDAFRYGTLVLASTTYNAEVFPPMREFIQHLAERGYKNRTVAFIENGSWAPTAAKVMKGLLEGCKGLTFAEPTVRILSALNAESEAQLDALADVLCQ